MTKKKAQQANLTDREVELAQQLRKHPELLERFQSILTLPATRTGH